MAVTQQMLDEARQAYHDLLTGRAVRVVVDQNGERIEYTAANRSALSAYISDLERQLGVTIPSGPMRVWF